MPADSDLVLESTREGVTTLTMNLPARLNGWTLELMAALKGALARCAKQEQTRAVVLTGADPYYSAGVNLSGTIRLTWPKVLHAQIVEHNEALFATFLGFPKPIVAAVNGPAIGAAATTAVLCDAIVASERASFSTPFAAVGVPPEGCSSVLFPALLGEATAQRMLGPEGFKPTGVEAEQIGLVDRVVPHGTLLAEAQALAAKWVAEGRPRTLRGGLPLERLRAVNAEESRRVADAFLSPPFLHNQYRFLRRKKKRGPAALFLALWLTHPAWSRLL